MASLTRDLLLRTRTRAGGIALDVFFRGISQAGRAASRVRPEEWGIRVHANIPYLGTGREAHRLDVWSAHEPGANAPVLFYLDAADPGHADATSGDDMGGSSGGDGGGDSDVRLTCPSDVMLACEARGLVAAATTAGPPWP